MGVAKHLIRDQKNEYAGPNFCKFLDQKLWGAKVEKWYSLGGCQFLP